VGILICVGANIAPSATTYVSIDWGGANNGIARQVLRQDQDLATAGLR